MKNALMMILAVIAVFIVWRLVMVVIGSVVHFAITILMIALFFWVVYMVFKMMTREKKVL